MRQAVVFRKTYDETMDLMVEARNYLSYLDEKERDRVDAVSGLRLSCEAMRVTSRLTQVMAWLLMQRAVQEGEITTNEALSDRNRLSGGDVCLDVRFGQDSLLPKSLRSLLDRSFRLYVRISRIEEQILERTDFDRSECIPHGMH
jgi:regulator of CtrA degradation